MRRIERDQDLAIGSSDRHTVAERQVNRVRHANVVDDHVELARGNDLTDIVLDLLKVDFGFLDPGPRRGPHVKPQLTGIDRRKEVPADERVQPERGDRKAEEHRHYHARACQCPIERTLVRTAKSEEARLEGIGDSPED